MKSDKQKTNWLIDAALFGGFLGSLWLDLTGVAAHQWLGLAVVACSGYHLWKHWSWVEAVTSRFFGRTSARSRAYYFIDAGLAVGLTAITVTGVAISTWLNLALTGYAAWHAVHVVASIATLALLSVKIGLHWRWIIAVARQRVFGPPATAPAPAVVSAATKPAAAAAASLGRRDFVRLMAGVGAVALTSGANALGAITFEQAESSSGAQTETGSQAASGTASPAASGTCTMRCNRGCSYPGHCRKYTDSNNNGRCDLGECLS
jgi:hypothetical protein